MNKGISLDKIHKMGILVLKNCIRLHFDSIKLYNLKSYPSAYYLSILALEELGKYYLLTDIVYHYTVGELEKKDIGEYVKIMYMHNAKQGRFLKNSNVGLPKHFYQDVYDKNLDIKKQNACYVGLPRKNGNISLSSKIIGPFDFKLKQSKDQITILNEELKKNIDGIVNDYLYFEIDISKILNRKLLNKLNNSWKFKNKYKISYYKYIIRSIKK